MSKNVKSVELFSNPGLVSDLQHNDLGNLLMRTKSDTIEPEKLKAIYDKDSQKFANALQWVSEKTDIDVTGRQLGGIDKVAKLLHILYNNDKELRPALLKEVYKKLGDDKGMALLIKLNSLTPKVVDYDKLLEGKAEEEHTYVNTLVGSSQYTFNTPKETSVTKPGSLYVNVHEVRLDTPDDAYVEVKHSQSPASLSTDSGRTPSPPLLLSTEDTEKVKDVANLYAVVKKNLPSSSAPANRGRTGGLSEAAQAWKVEQRDKRGKTPF